MAKAVAKRKLVIVESPSKAKTIGKFLGSSYKVIASVGHVRDLPKSKLGIEIEADFEPQYINIRGKGDVIKEIKSAAKNASKIYLATDPDREGEAISWHLAYLLGIDEGAECRVEFNEITKDTVKNAIKQPRSINRALVDAQQARRVLDRLVGYKISPLLWGKIKRGLSAGRVQSAALKMICDRENAINEFVPEEYWNIAAVFEKGKEFEAKLTTFKGKKLTISNKEEADKILDALRHGKYIVANVEEKQRVSKPYAPFTTSSLQQDAANKLKFQTKRTMQVAQQLYEGVDVPGKGTIGLVTYIRTDSVRISEEAKKAAKEYIVSAYGTEYAGNNVFANKRKEVQDAHEAIRPSDVSITPEMVKNSLTAEQYKLYSLIWTRFVASQMAPALYNSVAADIDNGDYGFRATGSKLVFDGYLKIYKSGKEDDMLLPQLAKGEELEAKDLKAEQKFTQPPARYTEATLVKDLEEKEIGRPSTYAPIVATLLGRSYIKRDKRNLYPTELGFTVTQLLEEYFKEIVDVDFTAGMENKLDSVEVDGVEWKSIIREFYGDFEKEIKVAEAAIERVEVEDELTGELCELCGKPMVIKHGRFGEFKACSGYPECTNTKQIVVTSGVACPKCGKEIIQRRSKRGKVFYGCSGYPQCTQAYWDKPVDRKCPKCGELLVEKEWKTFKYKCSSMDCNYRE